MGGLHHGEESPAQQTSSSQSARRHRISAPDASEFLSAPLRLKTCSSRLLVFVPTPYHLIPCRSREGGHLSIGAERFSSAFASSSRLCKCKRNDGLLDSSESYIVYCNSCCPCAINVPLAVSILMQVTAIYFSTQAKDSTVTIGSGMPKDSAACFISLTVILYLTTDAKNVRCTAAQRLAHTDAYVFQWTLSHSESAMEPRSMFYSGAYVNH